MASDEPPPMLAPFAPPPRPQFRSERGVDAEGEASNDDRPHRSDAPQPVPSADGARTRQLVHDLFEQAPPGELLQDRRLSRGDREPPGGRSEAEMFAIAFACCREMLFPLSDQFSSAKRADDGSAINP